MKGGESMCVIVEGGPKEIAALVLAVQGQQGKDIVINPDDFLREVVRSTTDDMQPDTSL